MTTIRRIGPITTAFLALISVAGLSCDQRGQTDQATDDTPGGGSREVVLASSVDEPFLRPIVRAYEEQTGVDVKLLTDTEATKTFGLVNRLQLSKDDPEADVWWSSEPFGTMTLHEAGVVTTDGLPGFAVRARVIAYHEGRVETPPMTMRELVSPAWRGRVGIARPEFGTTRGHMGFLLQQWGEPAFEAWINAMRGNNVRVYDSNSSVVRAIHLGEIDVGLTDTDDVWAGRSNGWAVGMSFEPYEPASPGDWFSPGAMLIPNTAAIVAGGPNADEAEALLAFIRSAQVERMLAESDSKNIPTIPEVSSEFPALIVETGTTPNLPEVAAKIVRAVEIAGGLD